MKIAQKIRNQRCVIDRNICENENSFVFFSILLLEIQQLRKNQKKNFSS